ncbi:galactose oxidase-like domain-containing protein [Methylobacterium komagatae]
MPSTSSFPQAARMRGHRRWLLSATMLAGFLPHPVEAAMYKVVVNQVTDPMLAGLTIPASAPKAGMWSGVYNWPINAISLGLLWNGKVVSYGTPLDQPGVQDGRKFDVWDPTQGFAGGAHVTLNGVVGINSFCAAQSYRFDGSTMTAGGIFDNGQDKGSAILNASATAIGASAAKLAYDRYYATMLTLPAGKQLILGGTYPYAAGFNDPQTSINNGYNTGMTPELYDGTKWTTLFGANSRDAFGPDNSRYWYPRAWVAPNGKVFGISSDKMWFVDPTGNGSVSTMAFRNAPQTANTALNAPNSGPASTAVMYDTGKILQVGGNSFTNGDGFLSSSRATVVDINGATPVATDVAPMSFGRAWANATVLPNGQVAVTGGSKYNDQAGANTVTQTEIWTPSTGQWNVGAAAAIYRGYHSTAILMQNGTLLSAGGGAPGPFSNQNAEIYYPPYLFTSVNGQVGLAPRPQIVSLSTLQLQHGASMQFELASSNGLSQVVLVGTSLVTHSFNSTQRRYSAAFSVTGNAVTVQVPASANVVPPGHYQLIAIDKNGVPSPGIIVALGNAVTAPTQATTFAPPSAGGTGTGGTSAGGTTGGGAGTAGAIPGWPASTSAWNQIGVTVTRIAAASDGLILGINSGNQSIWSNYLGGGWNALPGTAKDIAAVNVNSIYAVGTDGAVRRYDGNGQSWTQVGYGAVNIGAAADGTVAIVNVNNDIWVKRTDGNEDAWYQIPGKAKRVAPMSRTSFYSIGMDDNVYRSDATGKWVQIGRDASDIAVSSDGSIMVINKVAGSLWRKVGDNATEAWTQQPFTQAAISVAIPNAMRTVVVGKDTNIYRW